MIKQISYDLELSYVIRDYGISSRDEARTYIPRGFIGDENFLVRTPEL